MTTYGPGNPPPEFDVPRPGSHRPCGLWAPHAQHSWVVKGGNSPISCPGVTGDFPCCANVQDGYGHHPGCQNAPRPRVAQVLPLEDQLDLDLLLWGNAYVVDGKRVDPTTVVAHRRTPQGRAERVDLWPGTTPLDAIVAGDLIRLQGLGPDQDGDYDVVSVVPKTREALGYPDLPRVQDEQCEGAEPSTEVRTQDEFLTLLDELLDNTLHDSHCYVNPNDTVCVCILGVLRAVLPPCGAVQLPGSKVPGARGPAWKCLRNAHPANPGHHYFGED